MNPNKWQWPMKLALEQAELAQKIQEVPIGAVIVETESGKVVSKAHNLKESVHDPCGHAEILAIRLAAEKLSSWRLTGHSLFVTLEPCSMCMGAIIQARLDHIYFGAYDKKAGSVSLGLNLHQNKSLNHQVSVTGGILHHDCSKILSDFFRLRRQGHNIMKS